MPVLSQLGPGQVHIFSAAPLEHDPFVADLAARGIVVTHRNSLDSELSRLEQGGALPEKADRARAGHIIPIGDRFAAIDVATWNEVRRSARPVDLDLLRPPSFSSSASKYQEFRAFMGAPDGSPRWSGLAAKMNLRRDFEEVLDTAVTEALDNTDAVEPIVVSGQTATGKSIALAALAARLARSGRAAVLHQSRRTSRPSFDDVEKFAQWAEEEGAGAVVFVWDGMTDAGEYETLSRRLHARGRRVIVVGSTYSAKPDQSASIEAPAALSPNELRNLTHLLSEFGIEVSPPTGTLDSSFLAFLYRALPETEYALRHGLASELRAAERGLVEITARASENQDISSRATAIEAAFAAAGYQLPLDRGGSLVQDSTLYETSFEDRSAIQRVTTLVVVAGRYGLPVPIDLALRVLGREGSQSIRTALTTYDIIRDEEDGSGELSLVARSRLEALLIAQHEIPLVVEAEVVTTVIEHVRNSTGFSPTDEVSFLVQLLEVVGANGPELRFRPFYLEFANALRDRRENGGVPNPRLVLQESALVRAHIHWQQTKDSTSTKDRILDLEHNRDVLEDVLADDSVRGFIRLSLTVELASTLGAITFEITHANESVVGDLGLTPRLDAIFDAVVAALTIDPTNVHPVDVLAWTTRDALESGALSEEQRVDRAASALAMIESVDRASISDAKAAQLDERGATLEALLKNDDAVWRYLAALNLNADPAATYFLAQFDAREGQAGEAKALARLEASPASLADWRCASLYLNLAWKRATGSELMRGEREPLFLSGEDTMKMRALVERIEKVELPDGYRLTYVRAMLDFMEGDFSSSRRDFRTVQEATRQLTRRLRTTNLIADQTRRPRIFSGRVEWTQGRGGELWVNELGTRVRFDPLRFFASGEVAPNQSIPKFNIGFKLSTGAVAEPVLFSQGKSS
ncbi:hypothetical protein ACEXQD_17395 [Herbiconiux sp. P15]|uniref:P-loop NTPase n=1 Tax=Herbiconiux liukaitaii TaxID=3342799 RepID=UPI0035B7B649